MFAAVAVSVGACEVEYDPIVVLPDVTLENTGLTDVPTITIYQNDVYVVNMLRTEGLSRAASFDIRIDESLISAYNELNNASLKLMPNSCYTMDTAELAFEKKAKTASFPIQFKPEAILQMAGSVAAAENYVIPVLCIPRDEVNTTEKRLNTIIRFTFSQPTVTVEAPSGVQALSFIAGVPVSRKLEISGRSNFTTLDVSKMSLSATQEQVDAYNAKNGTDYVLLPKNYYSIDRGSFDIETLAFSYNITIDAADADTEKTFLLPLEMVSSNYSVVQDNVYYVKVNTQEIQISIQNTDRYGAAIKRSETIEFDVRLNGMLNEDFPVEFRYDASLVAAYGNAKGKSYEPIDASKVRIENAVMESGRIKTTAKAVVDMSDLPFEDGTEYALAFVLDKSKLPQGYVMKSDDVVYVRLKRTLYGEWSNRDNNGYLASVGGIDGWRNCNYMKTRTFYRGTVVDGVAYPYCNEYYTWGRGYNWRVIWDQPYNGDATKRKVDIFSAVTTGFSEPQQRANTIDHGSYFDMESGIVYLDFQYYWSSDDQKNDTRQTIKCYMVSPLTVEEF